MSEWTRGIPYSDEAWEAAPVGSSRSVDVQTGEWCIDWFGPVPERFAAAPTTPEDGKGATNE